MAFITTGKPVVDEHEIGIQHISSLTTESAVICKKPEKLHAITKSITQKHTTHFVSRGDWSMHDLVLELIRLHGPATLYISTYAIREYPVRQLVMAMETGSIKAIYMLLDYRAKVRTPEVFQLAKLNMANIYQIAIHAKVCVIQCPDISFTILGSANWTTNPKIEAGIVTTSSEVADFHVKWMLKIMDNAQIFN